MCWKFVLRVEVDKLRFMFLHFEIKWKIKKDSLCQFYASGDDNRMHISSFWNMRYREECTTSQTLEASYFCVQEVDDYGIEIINLIFNPFKRLCREKDKTNESL